METEKGSARSTQSSKDIYDSIVIYIYGGTIMYRNLVISECGQLVKGLWANQLSEQLRDTARLISLRRLLVRAVMQ